MVLRPALRLLAVVAIGCFCLLPLQARMVERDQGPSKKEKETSAQPSMFLSSSRGKLRGGFKLPVSGDPDLPIMQQVGLWVRSHDFPVPHAL